MGEGPIGFAGRAQDGQRASDGPQVAFGNGKPLAAFCAGPGDAPLEEARHGKAGCKHPTGAQLTTYILRRTRLERRFACRRLRRPRTHSRHWRR